MAGGVSGMMKATGYSYTIIAAGDSEVYREAAVPLASALEQVIPHRGGPLPSPLALPRDARNDVATVGVLLVGLILFVAKDMTKLAVTDVYTKLIKPRLNAVLEKIDIQLSGANRKTRRAFNCSIWYDEHDVLVSVMVVGNSFDEVVKQLHLIPVVHANALVWIAANGSQKPIHHYKIEAGHVNATPLLLDRLADAMS
jgi:hypothetical protein